MSEINLIDKRVYAIDYPKTNVVINSALDCLYQKSSKINVMNILENLLRQGKDDTINIAINLAPNVEVAMLIWDLLSNVISNNNNIMLIPVISILGTKEDNTFRLSFNNQQLKNILLENNIFSENIEVISNLNNSLSNLKFSQLYNLHDNWFEQNVEEVIFIKNGQAILLNYIVIKVDNLKDNNTYNLHNYNTIKNKISIILNQIQDKSLVTYTIPFEVTSILKAFNIGMMYYNDIRLHIELSNIIKKNRQNRLEPTIIVENNDKLIKLSINSNNTSTIIDWELSLIDDFSLISNKINSLLMDLQVEYAVK